MTKLIERLDCFFDEQLDSWPLLKKNVTALDNVIVKNFQFEQANIEVHFNPERIKSSSAKVDKKSIEERPCFLCDKNRPIEQKCILFLDRWKILCNPYPVLRKHFTIVRTEHIPQLIFDSFEDMLLIAKECSNKLTVFYNGPAHGASAPDHLHFQAVSSNLLPIEKLISEKDLCTEETFQYYQFAPLKFYLMIEKSLERVNEEFKKLFKKLTPQITNQEEPGINLIVKYNGKEFVAVVYERKKHRPECFFAEEPSRILISPAAIDMSGLLVLPRFEDIAKIKKSIIADIFDEVLA